MSQGFSKYFNIASGIDWEIDPITSFSKNHREAKAIHEDVRNIEFRKQDYQIVIGGSPCQDFSEANHKRDHTTDRANLIFEFIRAAKQIKPEFMLIENVTKVPKEMKVQLLKELKQLGYSVVSKIVNAYDFGSIQLRPRWITTASKFGSVYPIPGKIRRTAKEILTNEKSEFGTKKETLKRFKHLRKGVWDNLPGSTYKAYFVVDPDKPLPVVANPTKLRYVKPDRSGYLTKSELLNAFGLPNNFKVVGSLSSWSQQVANMVPYEVGEAFARAFYEKIRGNCL